MDGVELEVNTLEARLHLLAYTPEAFLHLPAQAGDLVLDADDGGVYVGTEVGDVTFGSERGEFLVEDLLKNFGSADKFACRAGVNENVGGAWRRS
jgi:hypothetical protein